MFTSLLIEETTSERLLRASPCPLWGSLGHSGSQAVVLPLRWLLVCWRQTSHQQFHKQEEEGSGCSESGFREGFLKEGTSKLRSGKVLAEGSGQGEEGPSQRAQGTTACSQCSELCVLPEAHLPGPVITPTCSAVAEREAWVLVPREWQSRVQNSVIWHQSPYC